jgi:hypothetical protein
VFAAKHEAQAERTKQQGSQTGPKPPRSATARLGRQSFTA